MAATTTISAFVPLSEATSSATSSATSPLHPVTSATSKSSMGRSTLLTKISAVTASSIFPATIGSSAPSASSSAQQTSNSGSLNGPVKYYFVFLALLLCLAGFIVFLALRKKQRERLVEVQNGRESALRRDLNQASGGRGGAWTYTNTLYGPRRYWQGRWRSFVGGSLEGLNEHGEAPPPYAPKRQSEERQTTGQNEDASRPGVVVPLETLSRDQTGLKPPDYTETFAQEIDRHEEDSTTDEVRATSSRTRHDSGGL